MIKKFAIIFGTRPEYLKMKSLIKEFEKRKILSYKVIYVTQHETIDETFDHPVEILHICTSKTPTLSADLTGKVNSYHALEKCEGVKISNILLNNRLSTIGSEILLKLPVLLNDCTDIIVQGDTATAFFSALTSFQLQINIIHLEAGLRTYDLTRPFPEEAYRQMISRLSTTHFTPHNDCSLLLNSERVSGYIENVGNTILDLINSYNLECKMDNIVLITFHRRENWNKIDKLLIGLKKLLEKTPHIKYKWYLHPNPELQTSVKAQIGGFNNIELKQPCGHLEFTTLISRSNFLITDSGGIQEEASFLGKHCVVLRASTERTHIPKEYITVLEDYSLLDEIYDFIPKQHLPICNVYGNGNTSEQILNIIISKTI